MSAPASHRDPRRLVAGGIVIGLVTLAAIPGYLALEPRWRSLALRLACAAGVAIACGRIARGVRRTLDGHSPSALDTPVPAAPAPVLETQFLRLREHLVVSRRSRRYFDTVLWPRLCALSRVPLPRPAPRRWWSRLGPSRATMERLIAQIERGT